MKLSLENVPPRWTCRAASVVLVAALLTGLAAVPATAIVYCNVTDIQAKAMPNGVQVTIVSDGILRWEWERGYYPDYGDRATQIGVRLENARSKIDKTFIAVNETPVSHVQISVPQSAEEGVGLTVIVSLTQPSTFDVDLSQDQQSLIITVNSDRTIERTNRTGAVARGVENGEAACDVEYADGLLSVRAVNAGILEVFGEIAAQSGAEIAVDDDITQYIEYVSMSLPRMEVDAVIRAISSAYGLALEKVGDVYMISGGVSDSLAVYNRSGTRSFPMQYVQAENASGLLPTFLYSYVHVNDEQNAVVVTAPRQMLDKIGADLGKTDVAPPQIMIEVVAVEMTSTEDLDLGLRWRYRGQTDDISADSTTGDLSYRELGPDDFAKGGDFYDEDVTVPTRELAVNLKALIEEGKAKIKAQPQMAAVNGERAEIFIGAQRFILVNFLQYGQQQERIQSVPVGVRLRVIPWTGGNNEITAEIQAEVSNIVNLDPETGLPRLSSRQIETTVRVADGETIVIGGLTLEQTEIKRRKVPILGDIPLIGSLFRSRTKSTENTDLVLFITPRLLQEGHLPEDQEREIKQRFLQEQAGRSG
ncbi:MAG: type II and III secretion system protein [Armatimonadota bacterium]|jgi:type IV pilus assembly protein PilQ